MKFAAALVLIVFCTPAHAADPWAPILDLFRARPTPIAPMPAPRLPDDAQAAIERAPMEAELQAAIKRANEAAEKAEEAAKAAAVPQEPPRDPKSPLPRPKAKTTAKPLSLAAPPRQPTTPEENDGSWLAPCFLVCGHVDGKSKAQLDADEIYWRVTARQKLHGQRCVVNSCPGAVPPKVLEEMKQKVK
jgi:hypothetical protein